MLRGWPDRNGLVGIFGVVCISLASCQGKKPPAVSAIAINPTTAAASALEAFDGNGDGKLNSEELAKCPPLAQALSSFDANSDGQLSGEEIGARLSRLFGSGSSLLGAECVVLVKGRPLPGAKVVLRPVAFLEGSLQVAEATTDQAGTARPSVGDAHLPANLQGSPLMQPGLYHVEITHPEQSLPAKYNTATELGFLADPISRTGSTATFRLEP